MSLLLKRLPFTVPGETINRLCSSGMSSVIHIQSLSVQVMAIFSRWRSRKHDKSPWVISKVSKSIWKRCQMYDSSFGWRFVNPKMKELYGVDGMGTTAENLAEKYKITRKDQDLFAYYSQMKAKAQSDGRFEEEIVSVEITQRKKEPIIFSKDEFIKSNTSLEILSKLRTSI